MTSEDPCFLFFSPLSHLGVRAHSAETLEFPSSLLGDSLKGHRDLGGISFAYRETLVGCTMVLVVARAVLVLTGSVVGIVASLTCSLFLHYSPCSVWTTYDWGFSAPSTTSSALYPNCLGGEQLGFSLAWISYLL